MPANPNIAAVAMLIGDPARAAMLAALLGGQSLPAGELSSCAGVSPQTASAHLAKLVEGGLLSVTTSGRHRYYRLKSVAVADALERLAALAPPTQIQSLRQSEEARALRLARTCYDHLAGIVGVAITKWMIAQEFLVMDEQTYRMTEAGTGWCSAWDIDLHALQQLRRHFARPCLDWSEREPHLAGALGAALTNKLFERGWITRIEGSRAVRLTEHGRMGLRQEFGMEFMDQPVEVGRYRAK